MSMDKIAMALDDVIKQDRKDNKGGKKNAGGAKKKGARGENVKPATAKLVKKLVKKAIAQQSGNGGKVVRKIKKPAANAPAGGRVVRKIIRKVTSGNRVTTTTTTQPLGLSNKSRTIVRKRIAAPIRSRPIPAQTVVREVRYVPSTAPRRVAPRVPRAPRVQRVVYEQPRPRPRERVVYVEQPRYQERPRYVRAAPPMRRRVPRNDDPFYEPRNFLQRLPANRY